MSAAPIPLEYERRPDRQRGTSRGRQFLVLLLLGAGVQAWIGLGRGQLGEKRQILAAILAVVATVVISLVPALRSRTFVMPTRTRPLAALLLTIVSFFYLYATARQQQRDFSPILHDEYAYLLQAKMIASGKLWLPRHEVADFFESFHLITDRVYAAKYGPGTATVYAIGMGLHVPPWAVSLALSSLAVGLLYLLVSRLLDDSSGLLAAIMLLALGMFRRTSIMTMSQPLMLVLALLAVLAYLRWREQRQALWMVIIGLCIGWGALCRPVDAVCIAAGLGLAILPDCLGRGPQAGRLIVVSFGAICIAALPFLAIQLIYNKGVTGSVTTMPWDYYAKRDDPYDVLGRPPLRPDVKPVSTLAQKQIFAEEFTLPAFRQKIGQSRLANLIDRTTRTLAGPPLEEQEKNRLIYGALPTPLLVTLLPLGLLALGRRRWVVIIPVALFLLIYSQYTFFLVHYAVAIVPGIILLVLAGKEVLQSTWPAARRPIGIGFTLVILALCVGALPQLNPSRKDQWFPAPFLRDVDRKLAAISTPAIVLFKFDSERSVHEEPVYNLATASPDDAPVIRAHDLGERNRELFAYYAKRSPARVVYRLDEKDGSLTRLGLVSELAR